MLRFLHRILSLSPLSSTEVLGLLVSGVSLCGFLLVENRPLGVPEWLVVLLFALGIIAIIRGVVGGVAAVLPRRLVDLDRYAQSLRDESTTLDVARLPALEPSFEGREEAPIDLETTSGRTLLIGGHGSGKSRLASEIAVRRLGLGRPGLHVRLSSWTDNLQGLLLRTLSAAAGRPIGESALETFLSNDRAFLVFDSLDEAPLADRQRVATEIDQFAGAHPWVDIVVTARASAPTKALTAWRRLSLAALSEKQIDEALGTPIHTLGLPSGIVRLAANPLMLGLLKAELSAGRKPSSESDLLDAYIEELILRQSGRGRRWDVPTGWRIAEEVAWGWLAAGRIGLTTQELRSLAARVAQSLASSGFLQADAPAVEGWFVESGLGAVVGATAVPTHRTLLDHLASRSVPRHPPDPAEVRDELREAIARYVGRATETDELVRVYLDELSEDLEFLARCTRLVPGDIRWTRTPQDFALSYMSTLRRLASGPLAGLGVVPQSVRIQIDPDLTWVFEEEAGPSSGDTVEIVAEPPRMYFSVGGGPKVPVQSYRAGGHQGRNVEPRVPQLAAFNRAKEELLYRLDKRLLEDEGPDIVYERLSRFATRTWEVLSVHGMRKPPEFSQPVLEHATTRQLVEFVVRWLSRVTKRSLSSADLAEALVVWSPPIQGVLLDAETSKDQPYDPSQGRSGLVIHFGPLLRLLTWAEKLGLADLPLSPLGLRPESETDPVLALPRHLYNLSPDQLRLIVTRHELAELRAIRHVVGTSFAGLADRIPSYSTLPWRISIALTPSDVSWSGGWSIQGTVETRAARDEVIFVEELPGEWSFSRSLASYRGVLEGVYATLKSDLQSLLQGERALGRREL